MFIAYVQYAYIWGSGAQRAYNVYIWPQRYLLEDGWVKKYKETFQKEIFNSLKEKG